MARPVPQGLYDGLDDMTATLALRLHIEDIDKLLTAAANDETRDDAGVTELQQTLLMQKAELQRSLSVIRDRKLSHSLAMAVLQDANAISRAVAEERQAERDREMAYRIAGIAMPPRPAPQQDPPRQDPPRAAPLNLPPAPQIAAAQPIQTRQVPVDTSITQAPVGHLSTQNCKRRREEEKNGQAGSNTNEHPQKRLDTGEAKSIETTQECPAEAGTISSKRRAEEESHTDERPQKRLDTGEATPECPADAGTIPPTDGKPLPKTCISCSEEFDNHDSLAQMPCGHEYCTECLQRIVINALVDEALYPPRCCRQPFDMDSMREFLTPEIISGFHLKTIEYASSNRVYCCNPICSAFLYPENIKGDKAECPLCFGITCTICKGLAHEGDCPKDSALQDVLTLATGEGWKRCGNCKAMIELRVGCNHITCRCKSEWCYVCLSKWKTCECAVWQERMLLNRAERIVQHNEGQLPQAAAPVAPAVPVQPALAPAIAAARQHVLANHGHCDHDWEKVRDFAICDECGRQCSSYFWNCNDCGMDVCWACMTYRR